MKIVHLCNYIQPKLGYQEYFLAKEHARMGHDVFVVTSDRYYPFPDYDNTVKAVLGGRIIGAGEEECEGFKIIRLNILFEKGTQVWLKGLYTAVKKIMPDLVICHVYGSINSVRIINMKKKLKFKLYTDSHGLFTSDSNSIMAKLFYFLMNKNALIKYNDRIIAVAYECAKYVEEKFRVPKNKIEMIPLGADTDIFKFDRQKRLDIRKKLLIKEDDFVVIFTGKIIKNKGVHIILEAIKKVKAKKKIVLIALGNGNDDYCDYLKQLSGSIHNCMFVRINAVENNMMPGYYSAGDIAVWPNEATIGTIEAMACSLPVVCHKSLKERYEAGNGFGVNKDDPGELAEILQFCIDNLKEVKKMGLLSKKTVEERFSWKVIAKKFI